MRRGRGRDCRHYRLSTGQDQFAQLPSPLSLLAVLLILSSFALRYLYLPNPPPAAQLRLQRNKARFFESYSKRPVHFEEHNARVVRARRNIAPGLDEIALRPVTGRVNAKKIVALVEVRNVAHALHSFLPALERLVDSVVILDDCSDDATRLTLFDICARGCAVELLLNKTAPWLREELRDRQLLLSAGRRVGGTHFVLLDYDEYFSADCVSHGTLRRAILALLPGESLFLPWLEVWKSISLHRVLPTDPDMNFLTRRQTVIFADDGKVSYTAESATARGLGVQRYSSTSVMPESRNASIHALRCPRSLCPQPSRYRGPGTRPIMHANVKHIPLCKIIEVRFLNLGNILVKSAWYEALGRIMGADASVTRGKMFDAVTPARYTLPGSAVNRTADLTLREMDPTLLTSHKSFDVSAYDSIETWRAKELLLWMDKYGENHFRGLEAVSAIDIAALRRAVKQTSSVSSRSRLMHVPLLPSGGTFVLAVDRGSLHVSDFLRQVGWTNAATRHRSTSGIWAFGVRLGKGWGRHEMQYEEWRNRVEQSMRSALARSEHNVAFCSTHGVDEQRVITLLELLAVDFADVRIVVLFGDRSSVSGEREGPSKIDELRTYAERVAMEPGGHVRVIDVAREAFGSYAAMFWLRSRIAADDTKCRTDHTNSSESWACDAPVLAYTENFHSLASDQEAPLLLPVARMVFSLNVGRSGSRYLARVLASVNNNIIAVHEPGCEGGLCSGGGALRMQDRKLSTSYEERMAIKHPLLRQAIASVPRKLNRGPIYCRCDPILGSDGSLSVQRRQMSSRTVLEINGVSGCSAEIVEDVVYAETNPNFKSWFYDIVLDNFPSSGYDVTVVLIRKYIAASLKSLYETGYFTSRDGYNWMETANSVNAQIESISNLADFELDAHDKLISYLLNAETVMQYVVNHYQRERQRYYPQRGWSRPVVFVPARAESMYGKVGGLELVRQLGFSPSATTLEIFGVIWDKYRAGENKTVHAHTSLSECEHRVAVYIANMTRMGVPMEVAVSNLGKVAGYEYPQ